MKGKNSVKDKKKVPSVNVNKSQSDYQTGKGSVSKMELTSPNKKRA
jgi:hypothetical protein